MLLTSFIRLVFDFGFFVQIPQILSRTDVAFIDTFHNILNNNNNTNNNNDNDDNDP